MLKEARSIVCIFVSNNNVSEKLVSLKHVLSLIIRMLVLLVNIYVKPVVLVNHKLKHIITLVSKKVSDHFNCMFHCMTQLFRLYHAPTLFPYTQFIAIPFNVKVKEARRSFARK